MTADISSEIIEITKKLAQYILVLKEKTCQPTILYPEKTDSRNKGEVKPFPNKEKLR